MVFVFLQPYQNRAGRRRNGNAYIRIGNYLLGQCFDAFYSPLFKRCDVVDTERWQEDRIRFEIIPFLNRRSDPEHHGNLGI